MAIRKSVCKKAIAEDFSAVTFTFTNGKVLTCNVNDLPQDIRDKSAAFGVNHKIGDSYAQSPNVDSAYETASKLWDAMVGGSWTVKREPSLIDLIDALARIKGMSQADAKEIVCALPDDKRALLMKAPQIIEAMAEIELERAKAAAANSTDTLDAILG